MDSRHYKSQCVSQKLHFGCSNSSLDGLMASSVESNFSCSHLDLSRTNVTPEVWTVQSEGFLHDHSIFAVAILQTAIVAIGIPWNTIILAFTLIKKYYKETTYILLMNLVVADLLVCTCVLPFNVASSFARQLSLGSSDYVRCQVCQTIVITILASVFVSLFTLALISLDRLIYVKWPLLYETKVSNWKVLILLVAVWIFCIFISLPPIFGIGDIKFANTLSTCSLVTRGRTDITANISYVVILGFIAAFPFLTTLFADIWLLVIACTSVRRRHAKRMSTNSDSKESATLKRNQERQLRSEHQKQHILLAQVFGAIFAANVITWLPTIVISVVSAAIGAENVPVPLLALVYLAYISQLVIHPMLETCLIGKAKEKIFRCLCFCRKHPD